ncbi:MAG: hypothetical protein JSW50_02155 [Candidatus Latescibacterota bacterium]|nr:MAG: hypothetical protein JSW50_02155 [Candidatus Latescibacterota bacterium]
MEAGNQDTSTAVRELSLPIYQSKGWLRLLGVLSIVSGCLAAITIVGILYAWLPIWVGVLLLQAASSVERAYLSGSKEVLFDSLGKLKLYFIIQGVTTLIGLMVAAITLFFTGLGAIFGILQ